MGNFIEPIKAMAGQVSMDSIMPPTMSAKACQTLLGVSDSTMSTIGKATGIDYTSVEKQLSQLGKGTTAGNTAWLSQIQSTLDKLFSSYQGVLGTGTTGTTGTTATTSK